MTDQTPPAGRLPRLLFKLFAGLSLAYFAGCIALLLSEPFRVIQLRPLLANILIAQLPLGLCLCFYFFAGDPSRTGFRNALLGFALVVLHSFVLMPRVISTAYERWMAAAPEAALVEALRSPEDDAMIPNFAAVALGRRGTAAKQAAPALAALAADPSVSADLRRAAAVALEAVARPVAAQ